MVDAMIQEDRKTGRFDLVAAAVALANAQRKAGQPDALFKAFDAVCAEAVGHRLFTLLAWDASSSDVQRVYSSRPSEYPLGARKPMGPTAWGAKVLKGSETWIARNADEIRWAFPDHELILSLGCEACINAPVRWDGTVLGAVSVLGPAGAYDEQDLAGLGLVSQLLAPGFLALRR